MEHTPLNNNQTNEKKNRASNFLSTAKKGILTAAMLGQMAQGFSANGNNTESKNSSPDNIKKIAAENFMQAKEGGLSIEEQIESKLHFSHKAYQDIIMEMAENSLQEKEMYQEINNLLSVIEDQTRLAEPRYFDYSKLITSLKNHYSFKVRENPTTNPQIFLGEYQNLLKRMNAGNDVLINEKFPSLTDSDFIEDYQEVMNAFSEINEKRKEAQNYIKKNAGIQNVRLYDSQFNDAEDLLKKTDKEYIQLGKKLSNMIPDEVKEPLSALRLIKSNIEMALSDIPENLLAQK